MLNHPPQVSPRIAPNPGAIRKPARDSFFAAGTKNPVILSCFVAAAFLFFAACASKPPVKPMNTGDPLIDEIAMSLIEASSEGEKSEFDQQLEVLSEDLEVLEKVNGGIEEFSTANQQSLPEKEIAKLDMKVGMINKKIKEMEKPEPEPVITPPPKVITALDPDTERIIAIQRMYESEKEKQKTPPVVVMLLPDDYLLVEEFKKSPGKVSESKKIIENYYHVLPNEADNLRAAETFFETLGVAIFRHVNQKGASSYVYRGELSESEMLNDKKIRVTFFLPKSEIKVEEKYITLVLQSRQNIGKDYMVLLKDFTLQDESNRPNKYLLTSNSENLENFLLKKNEPKNVVLKFLVPEDESPQKKITLSFNFENNVYLFTHSLPIR